MTTYFFELAIVVFICQITVNGEMSEDARNKVLELEYQHQGSNGSGTNQLNGSKLTTMAQAQGNVVKVAMYGEFPVTKAE